MFDRCLENKTNKQTNKKQEALIGLLLPAFFFHSVYFIVYEKVDEIQSCLGGDSHLKFT